MSDPLQLLRLGGERKEIFDVRGADGIVGQFLLALFAWPQVVGLDAELGVPRLADIAPVFVPFHRFAGMAEELDLHLLEFAAAECVVAMVDFVSKCLANLRYSKGQLEARAVENVAAVGEDSLGSFGAEICNR